MERILILYHLGSLSSSSQSLYNACIKRKINDGSNSPGWGRRSFAAGKKKAEGNLLLHWAGEFIGSDWYEIDGMAWA